MRPFGEVTVKVPTYRTNEGNQLCRPFQRQAKVSGRSDSTRGPRVLTDLGANVLFAQDRAKIREHDGLHRANGAAATITEGHVCRMTESNISVSVKLA
jgi:hypothetical protein